MGGGGEDIGRREGGSLSATGYKRGSSPLPTLYLLLHSGVVVVEDARGAVSVIFTGVHWVHLGPTSYLSGKPIKQSKHYPGCNQALHHIASEYVSSYLVQSTSFLQTMPIHPSRSSMMSSQARLPICETARQTRRQPSARSTPVKLEESAFCILEAWRGVRGCCKW